MQESFIVLGAMLLFDPGLVVAVCSCGAVVFVVPKSLWESFDVMEIHCLQLLCICGNTVYVRFTSLADGFWSCLHKLKD